MKLTKLNENKTLAEYEKEWEEQNGKTCDKCGTKLNDGGTCPKCDDGEESLQEKYTKDEMVDKLAEYAFHEFYYDLGYLDGDDGIRKLFAEAANKLIEEENEHRADIRNKFNDYFEKHFGGPLFEESLNSNSSDEFMSYKTAIENHKANGTEKELDAVISSAYNDLNRETRLTGPEFNKLCDLANLPDRKIEVRESYDPDEDESIKMHRSYHQAVNEIAPYEREDIDAENDIYARILYTLDNMSDRDLSGYRGRAMEIRKSMGEAYDPQEFNPDATGPIYDMNVQFYSSLEKAIKEERWEDAAREYCEIKADLDQELQDADRKPIIGKLFKLFAKPHLRTLDNYKRRIPAEYLNACDQKNESLNEAVVDKFYIDEIVSAQGGKTETERHSFDTIEELKQYVKDANLTPEDIENCGKCEVKDLFESDAYLSKEEEEEFYNELRSALPKDGRITSTPKDTTDPELANKMDKWLTDKGYPDTNEALGVGAGLALGGAAIGAGMVGSALLDSLDKDEEGEDMDELFDIKVDAKGFGGSGNNVHVGPGSMPLTASLDRDKKEKHTRHYGKDYDDEFTLMGY